MKRLLFAAFAILMVTGLFENALAQKIRLRGKVTPPCATSSSLKYADIYADGNIAVMGSYNCRGAFIIDISNPDSPTLASWYNPGANQQFLEAIVIGNRGYFGAGNGSDGVHIVDLTNPASPVLINKVNATAGGGYPTIHEMMVFDQTTTADGTRRYLLENSNGAGNNVRIIDISNPNEPELKYNFLSNTGGWIHAMHIRGNRMYLSGFTGSSRVDIYDIENLAGRAPQFLGAVAVGADRNHSAWTDESGNFLYSARELGNGDLRVYDVTNPASPALVRSFQAANLNLNAITPHNPVVMGNKLYVAWYQAGTQVFDITSPGNPARIAQYDTYQPEFAPSEEELKTLDRAEPWDIICGSDSFGNALPLSYGGNWAVFPFLGEDKVLLGDLTNGLLVVDVSHATENNKNVVSDFDGDGKTDYSVFRSSTGDWTVEKSSDGSPATTNWGQLGDVITPGDYDGDGKTDHSIFRPATGTWWFVMSSDGSRPAVQWGVNGDIPVPADYDADGRTDIAVWRPSTGVWYINQSTLGVYIRQWGVSTDKVFAGDYEGDGKADLVAWRPSNGVWYVLQSSSSIPMYFAFGISGDKAVFADYDGDARSDFSVYRPSTGVWYGRNSSNNAITAYQFGIPEDVPVPADYDGDGKTDISVFRPSTHTWYRVNSGSGTFSIRTFGETGDTPSPSSVNPQ